MKKFFAVISLLVMGITLPAFCLGAVSNVEALGGVEVDFHHTGTITIYSVSSNSKFILKNLIFKMKEVGDCSGIDYNASFIDPITGGQPYDWPNPAYPPSYVDFYSVGIVGNGISPVASNGPIVIDINGASPGECKADVYLVGYFVSGGGNIITIGTEMIDNLLAYAGQLFTDTGLFIALGVGLPVGFWVINKAMNLVIKRK